MELSAFMGSLAAFAFIPDEWISGLDGVPILTPLLAPSWCVDLDFLLVHPLLATGHHWRGKGFLLDQHSAFFFHSKQ